MAKLTENIVNIGDHDKISNIKFVVKIPQDFNFKPLEVRQIYESRHGIGNV